MDSKSKGRRKELAQIPRPAAIRRGLRLEETSKTNIPVRSQQLTDMDMSITQYRDM